MTRLHRSYFYFIDINGQLFLEETKHKNFTSCFKDKQFLDFFYNRLQFNKDGNGYPFVSNCGIERNYVKAQDAPIVFQDIINEQLLFAGNLKVPFDPKEIYVSRSKGLFYHPLYPFNKLPSLLNNGLGLLRSSLVLNHLERGMSSEKLVWKGKECEFKWID